MWILQAGQPGGPAAAALHECRCRRSVFTADSTGWSDNLDYSTAAGQFTSAAGKWGAYAFRICVRFGPRAWIDSATSWRQAYAKILAVADRQKAPKPCWTNWWDIQSRVRS